jgi:hypothetical protein
LSDLAALGSLLNVTAVGVHDNFLRWAGTLLAAIAIAGAPDLWRRAVAGSGVPGEFTVAELAKAIELKEIEQAGGDYRELLRELDGLSDEEVRALLAEEQDAT